MENVNMKRISNVHEHVTVCVAATLLLASGSAYAQINRAGGANQPRIAQPGAVAQRGGEKSERVLIKSMSSPNKTAMVRTPDFSYDLNVSMPKNSKKPREWALFEVKYESEAKWTDELTFDYHVMTKGRNEEGKEAFSYYTTTIRYINVPKGEHMSCVVIPPSLVERYGEPVAITLQIIGKDGTVSDSRTETEMRALKSVKEWWTDDLVMKNANVPVTPRTGLVDRSKTPFALINADDYEVVK
jgi:hypothetical protein